MQKMKAEFECSVWYRVQDCQPIIVNHICFPISNSLIMPSPLEVGRKVIFDEELIYTCHLMSPPLQIQKPCKQKSPINCFYNVFVLSPILFHLEVVL